MRNVGKDPGRDVYIPRDTGKLALQVTGREWSEAGAWVDLDSFGGPVTHIGGAEGLYPQIARGPRLGSGGGYLQ
jgi:hypothetical protein